MAARLTSRLDARLRRARVPVVSVVVVGLALLVLVPVLWRRGYVLAGDMVFVPDQPFKPAWLGLDEGVPRAVPSDALTWVLGLVVPGDLLQKAVLLAILVVGGIGVARLVATILFEHPDHPDYPEHPGGSLPPWCMSLPPAVLFLWNPYVYERLAIGHWALLCGYAALPWVVLAARRLRDEVPRATSTLVLPLAVAAWTSPTGGILAGLTAMAVVLGRPRVRPLVTSSAAVLVVNLPWLVPALLHGGGEVPASGTGVEAFAARADSPWGPLGSLASFGGMWKASVDPPGRDSWVLAGAGLLLTVVGLWGLARMRRRDAALAGSLAVVGAVGLLLAWLPTTGPGVDLMEWVVLHVPGGGLLRDSQKWLAPFILAVCVGLGESARITRWESPRQHVFRSVATALVPVAALPALAWGLSGAYRPVDYPDEWFAVRTAMEAARVDEGRVAVLPFDVYRRFPWNGERAVLDPAPRFFPGQMVVNDALPVEDAVVPGESEAARRIARAEESPSELRDALRDGDVRWVLVEKQTPGGDAVVPLGGEVLHDGASLRLVDLGGPATVHRGRWGWMVLAADCLALAVVLAGAVRARRPYSGA